MRLRSSSRCSRRLMPGNSALSVTAVRARSTMSVMMGDCLLRLTLEAVARQFRVVTRDRFELRYFLMHGDHPRRRAFRAHRSSVARRPNGQRARKRVPAKSAGVDRRGPRSASGDRPAPAARNSSSICILNSLLARRNSSTNLPSCRPISGSFLGPKMTSASPKMKMVSGKLIALS